MQKIKIEKDDIVISKRKKVYISDEDLKLLIATLKGNTEVKHLLDRFKAELQRRTGKRETDFEGTYIDPKIIKKWLSRKGG